MKIYNTLTKRLDEFVPVRDNKVGFYMCGMTVQDRPHLGHLRTFTTGDIVRRYLIYKGYEVTYVTNFTDIDDKIIQKSHDLGIDWRKIGETYVEEFFRVTDAINIMRADYYPRATQFIQEIIEAVEVLVKKGYAYEAGGDVWYDVRKKPDYGKLSGKKLEDLLEGARVEPSPNKRFPMDFAVWKGWKEGEPYWWSPWGKGRPGWHIECSVMSTHFLGQPFDIHGGAQDLIFPHHENEIAQSEALRDTEYVKYWLHGGFVNIKGEKMSKSKGLFFAAEEVLKEYGANPVRLYFLQTHYRSPIDFSAERLLESKKAWERIENFLNKLPEESGQDTDFSTYGDYLKKFEEAMDDDFNTPKAVAIIFKLLKQGNTLLEADPEKAQEIGRVLKLILNILGFKPVEKKRMGLEEDLISIIIEVRQKMRQEKNFAVADWIRDQLKNLGVILEDTPKGTIFKIK